MENKDIAIKAENVYKEFRLPHEKVGSVKNIFTNLIGYIRKRRIYETQHALRNISFDIKKGEFFGIVGRNGSGKSTLLKMLAGIYQPTKGNISVDGRLVPFIELGVGFNAELTGRENVYLNGALIGFSKEEIDKMYDDIVKFAEIGKFMDQKLKNYSSGMQVRLAFSLAIRADADILLVDEVLAVGDADFQRKCFRYFKQLKKKQKTVVFVTHDMNAVREYCDRAMIINDSEIKLLGDPQDVAIEYSRLFSEEKTDQKDKTDNKRWGSFAVRIKNAEALIDGDYVVITASAIANASVDKLIYGMHVLSEDGKEVTAMNNRMIQAPDIKNITQGAKIRFQWRTLNIFNDGHYFVTLTLVDDVYNTVDWFTKAATFKVRRTQRSTTAVFPPVTVTSHIKSNQE